MPRVMRDEEGKVELPEDRLIYRYCIELRDLRDGSVRELPLRAFKLIHLTAEKGAPQPPDEVELQVEDGAEIIKARVFDDLAVRLRLKYPDGAFERYLRSERDRGAEKRKAEAMGRLIGLLAEAVLEDLLHERSGPREETSRGQPSRDMKAGRKQHHSKQSGSR